jgi:hypothetical protein
MEEDFFWYVQPGAYLWGAGAVFGDEVEHADSPPALGVGYYPPQRGSVLRRYAPLRDHTGLFRVFAEIEPTEQGTLRFADRFGLLLSARVRQQEAGGARGPAAGRAVFEVLAPHAERLESWRGEIVAMRHAVAVWQQLEAGEGGALARHIRWERDQAGVRSVVIDTHPDLPPGEAPAAPDLRLQEVVADREGGADWLTRFPPGDPLLPAKVWLARLLNRRLGGGLAASFGLDGSGRMSLVPRPQTLLQALWLQFGLAVAGHKTYRRCSVCQDWFEVSPGAARTNRRFCSVACKNRAYRDRQARARQLRTEGKSLGEIAEELETTVATVKRWLQSGRKDG